MQRVHKFAPILSPGHLILLFGPSQINPGICVFTDPNLQVRIGFHWTKAIRGAGVYSRLTKLALRHCLKTQSYTPDDRLYYKIEGAEMEIHPARPSACDDKNPLIRVQHPDRIRDRVCFSRALWPDC